MIFFSPYCGIIIEAAEKEKGERERRREFIVVPGREEHSRNSLLPPSYFLLRKRKVEHRESIARFSQQIGEISRFPLSLSFLLYFPSVPRTFAPTRIATRIFLERNKNEGGGEGWARGIGTIGRWSVHTIQKVRDFRRDLVFRGSPWLMIHGPKDSAECG